MHLRDLPVDSARPQQSAANSPLPRTRIRCDEHLDLTRHEQWPAALLDGSFPEDELDLALRSASRSRTDHLPAHSDWDSNPRTSPPTGAMVRQRGLSLKPLRSSPAGKRAPGSATRAGYVAHCQDNQLLVLASFS